MASQRAQTGTWLLGILLAVAVASFLTLALDLKGDGGAGDSSWRQPAWYFVVGSAGVALVALTLGWNALWTWPLATFVVAVVWEELFWDASAEATGYFTVDAIGAFPTAVLLVLPVFIPAAILGGVVRGRLDRAGRSGPFAPIAHPWGPALPTWASLTILQVVGIGWFVVARWFLVHSGDPVFARFASGECFGGSPTFAGGQAVVALAGLLALAVAIVSRMRGTWADGRVARVSLVGAMVLLAAWCLVVVVLQPNENLGIYAGCGGA